MGWSGPGIFIFLSAMILYPSELRSTSPCQFSCGGQSRGGLIVFRCHHAPAFRILIVGATGNAAVGRPAERRPASRQFLRDFGHSTAKELRRPKVGEWRGNLAALVHVGLTAHSERVAVTVEDVL